MEYPVTIQKIQPQTKRKHESSSKLQKAHKAEYQNKVSIK